MTTMERVTADTLDAAMGIDAPGVAVLPDGTTRAITPADAMPYLEVSCDCDGTSRGEPVAEGYELLTGWTGQYGYSGAAMHASEYIGGALARHILETPGYWQAAAVYPLCDHNGDDCAPESWAVAFFPLAGE